MKKRGRKPKDPTLNKSIVNGCFNKVIAMVEEGLNISEALYKLGVNRGMFYKTISKQQKCLLDMAKTSNTKYGVGSNIR